MAVSWHNYRSHLGRRGLSLRGILCLMLGLAVLVTLPGCSGCRKDPAKTREELKKKLAEQKKKKPKPNFEGISASPPQLATRPSSGLSAPEPKGCYKPGHWTSTTLAVKANNFHFVGDLEIAATDAKGNRIPLTRTEFDLTTMRQVALPKRQPKVFESVLFVPPVHWKTWVTCRLNWRKGRGRAWEVQDPTLLRMPSYQYHFVVLSRWPQYSYLNALASVKPPSDRFAGDSTKPYYRVAEIGQSRRILLPAHGLLWTSIAYVLWDDVDPGTLNPDLQLSLLDWLHWGGQLILSGPDTLDTLRNSFLAPYLPATAAGVRTLTAGDFEALQQWSSGGKDQPVRPLRPTRPLAGVQLQKHAEARFIPGSGQLLIERRVGRGRVVVSAFRLSSPEVTSWPGIDELLNGFLLRRPGRTFTDHAENGLQVRWADGRHRLDASRISNLRYFVRDAGVRMKSYGADVLQANLEVEGPPPPGPGVAAWNDLGPVPGAAREALLGAAQIEIPRRDFVLWVVAGYLLVLVPSNWAFFRLIGRVEWAWAAAPVIAVVCAGVVIRAAQLDIGFARSRTEIAVIELHAGYQRAHVTRYTALYTALTTQYDFHSEDPGAQMQAFPKSTLPPKVSAYRKLIYCRSKDTSLSNYYVRSNSTGLVHTEQMLDLGGPISLSRSRGGVLQVANRTDLALHDAGVVRKDESGNLETAWIGTLEPGTKARVRFRRRNPPPKGTLLFEKQFQDAALTGDNLTPGSLNLRRLTLLAEDQTADIEQLQPGDMRLIAGVKQEITGLTIKPAAPQTLTAGLLIAHLQCGFTEDPQPDTNTRANPQQIKSSELEEAFQVSANTPKREAGKLNP